MSDTPLSDTRDLPGVALVAGVMLVVGIHLAALVVFPTDPRPVETVAVEALSAVVVAVALVASGQTLRWALPSGLLVGASALVTWQVAAAPGIAVWEAAIGLVGVATLLSYGIHRYEMLVLGLLEEEPT